MSIKRSLFSVCGRVIGFDELNVVEGDLWFIRCFLEVIVFNKLMKESDGFLCVIFVGSR